MLFDRLLNCSDNFNSLSIWKWKLLKICSFNVSKNLDAIWKCNYKRALFANLLIRSDLQNLQAECSKDALLAQTLKNSREHTDN